MSFHVDTVFALLSSLQSHVNLLIFLIILVNIYLVTSTIILLYIKVAIFIVVLLHIFIHTFKSQTNVRLISD